MKEWNISYRLSPRGGWPEDGLVVFRSWWKVLLWVVCKSSKCDEFYVWVTEVADGK